MKIEADILIALLSFLAILNQGCLPKDGVTTVPHTLSSSEPLPIPEPLPSPEATHIPPPSPYGVDQPGTPKLMNLGIQFGRYDAQTGRAGDFIFVKDRFYPKFFGEFGIVVEGAYSTLKRLPEFDYRVAKDTPLLAMVDGIVATIVNQSEDDYYLWIRPDTHPNWIIEYDHVKLAGVIEGQHVTAGQVVAISSNPRRIGYEFNWETMQFEGGAELSFVEIMVLPPDRTYRCPTDYLHSDVEATIKQQITDLMSDWEAFQGDSSLYDEASMTSPGCLAPSLTDEELDLGPM